MQDRLRSLSSSARTFSRVISRAEACAIRSLSVGVFACLAMASASCALRAQTASDTVRLNLREARRLALKGNPELLASRLDTAVARGLRRQAKLAMRFNPSIDVLGAGSGRGPEPAIQQEVELFGQRRARVAAAEAALDRARSSVADVQRQVISDVDRAFYRLTAAMRRASLADEVLALNERLSSIAANQLEAGEISGLDYNLAAIEVGRSRARALTIRRERGQFAVELARLVGLATSAPIRPVLADTAMAAESDTDAMVPATLPRGPSLALNVDSLTRLALSRRPDLAERSAAIREASALTSVARREALPNLVLRGVSEKEPGEDRAFRAGLGLALPLFNFNRGEVEARRATAQQAVEQRGALVARIRSETAAVVAAYEAASDAEALLASTVLAPARKNRQLLEGAYRQGKIGLPVLLLVRNQVIDAELEYWQAWLEAREARAALDEATGGNLDPVASTRVP